MIRTVIYIMVVINVLIGLYILFGSPKPFGNSNYRTYGKSFRKKQ